MLWLCRGQSSASRPRQHLLRRAVPPAMPQQAQLRLAVRRMARALKRLRRYWPASSLLSRSCQSLSVQRSAAHARMRIECSARSLQARHLHGVSGRAAPATQGARYAPACLHDTPCSSMQLLVRADQQVQPRRLMHTPPALRCAALHHACVHAGRHIDAPVRGGVQGRAAHC